ncbi:DUF4292 domain-containing protein [bacterium]|nr:DUF4292 domain-containing protein [bacterium]
MQKLLALVFITALITGTGCAPPKEIIRQPVTVEGIKPMDLVRKNNENGKNLRYMKAVTTLNLESPKSANQLSAQIAVKFPDSIYIKIEGILGIDGLKASLNRQTFVVYNIINRYVIQGTTSSSAIRKTFDYDIGFDEMVELLIGLPRLKENELVHLSELSAEESYYVMTFRMPNEIKKVWIDPYAQCAVMRIRHFDINGDIFLEKEFTRFENIDGNFLPRYVRIVKPNEKDLLSIFFNVRTLNKSFNSSLFTIKYPDDVKIIEQN